ncbi:hypothetical protein [Microbulbifer sp. TYP-18]|uniref:hypothetical protein n=1 Tax=Microbulbifer sp. TYP-18 TaxID=3230024 RepID=UPI0034C634D5
MAAVNRGATELADFLTTDQINAVSELAGSEFRVPSLTDALSAGTAGNFMEEGLAKDVVRAGGEFAPAAVSGGALVRNAAQQLPAMASRSEGALSGALREAGKSGAAADAALGGLAGAGTELGGAAGEAVGGETGRQVGEMLGALALPVAAGASASRLARMPQKPTAALADEDGITREGARLVASGKIDAKQAQLAVETAEQQARRRAFERVGVKPTRAQLTRSADDFREQQELGKHSGAIRNALEEQDSQLTQRVDELAGATGGASREAHETGYAIEDAITRRLLFEDELVSGLYRQADEAAKGGVEVSLNGFEQALRANAAKDPAINNVLRSIVGTLRAQGIIAPKGLKVQARVSPEQAERMIRQEINQHHSATNGLGKQVLHDLKSALDEDVFRAAGDDFYKQARNAMSRSRKALEQVKKHKFYQNNKSVVKQILEGGIAPEDIFGRLVVGKGGKVDDLKLLKTYLNSGDGELGEAGKSAWNDLRAQTLVHLRDRATKALATNQKGERTFSGAEFRKAIDGIGKPKLKEILEPEELSALEAIARVGELRIPVPGTALGDGPTGVAVNSLKESLGVIERATLRLLELGYKGRRARGVLDAEIIDMPVISQRREGKSLAPLVGALDVVNQ